MIKVIAGKLYNTRKATLLLECRYGLNSSDFGYRAKSLYLTSSGNWFFYDEGGALSDMAVSIGNGSSGSSDITPCTVEEAYEFLENNSDDSEALEALENYFAEKIVEA